MSLPLAGSTFGYLQHSSLTDALRDLAAHGIRDIELTPMPPHLDVAGFGAYERRSLRRRMDGLGLSCLSVNPGFVDLNLISTNREFRALTLRQLELGLGLAHDLGAPYHVVVAGRRHALSPAPADDVEAVLLDGLEQLLALADARGVTIVLENSPYGFLGRADELRAIVDEVGHPRLGVCYDVANALALEDPVEGLRQIGDRLALAHISDTWAERWAHTSVGRGEVDFGAFAAGLTEIGYRGATVYELVDEEDPAPRLDADLAALARHGWTVDTAPAADPAGTSR
jgi:sugar phosphate isomerase/epimerase